MLTADYSSRHSVHLCQRNTTETAKARVRQAKDRFWQYGSSTRINITANLSQKRLKNSAERRKLDNVDEQSTFLS